MVLRYYFRVIQQAWWLIALITLLALTVSLAVSYTTTPLYRSRASLIVFPNASLTSSRDVVTSLDTLDKRSITSTYEGILNSDRVYEETLKSLALKDVNISQYHRYTEVQADSNTINLFVEGPDPRVSAKLANGIGENSIRYIKGIYQVFDISFLDQAVPSMKRVKPEALRNGAIALAIGFLAGTLLAILVEQMRQPLESLRRRTILDKITAAYSQRHFKHLLDQEIARNPDAPLSLALLDLEGLQGVVDVLPESVLSTIMQSITDTLRRQLRGNDIIGKWGQTSYALLLPGTPGNFATRSMERIRQALLDSIKIPSTGEEVKLLPCAGITERLAGEEPASAFIQRAENALEQAHQSEQKVIFATKQAQGD